jgi:UDP-N-acetylmuramoyl-tripeptide--D-alanyl-D-alanine ligase
MKNVLKIIIVWVLTLEAKAVLRKYKPNIVAVTGSVGKTTTKDAVYAALSKKFHVRKSQKSFNSEFGLPLTILGAQNAWDNPLRWIQILIDGVILLVMRAQYPDWLVLEVGADRPGDISGLSSWLKTDVVVITYIPDVPVHVEFFDSPEAVAMEKASLVDTLKPGGTLILNGDDKHTAALAHRLPAPDAKLIYYGFGTKHDVHAEHPVLVKEEGGQGWPVGMRATLVVFDESVEVEMVGALGGHAFLPCIAAAAVAHTLGLGVADIAAGVESYTPPPGRMRLIPGIKDTLLIDDTYNASPAATTAGVETLGGIRPKRAIAVLGDMLELGRHSVEEHRKLGAVVAENADMLVTVGFRARGIVEGALDNGLKDSQILQYEDSRKAGEELKNMIQPGDVILVKGSQSMRMERVVEELMLEPERASQLLVRQDAEWKRR